MGKVRELNGFPVVLSMHNSVAEAVCTGDLLFLDEALGSHPSSQNNKPRVTKHFRDWLEGVSKSNSSNDLHLHNWRRRRGMGASPSVLGTKST
jgi:hypothetical protein